MNTTQLIESLTDIFDNQKERLVFWYDPDQEFSDVVPALALQGVTIIQCDQESLLELKIRLELKDREGRFLLYFPYAEPEPDKDWLLDMKLYSRTFHADRASIILNDLGLSHQSMRSHLESRKKFFNSQDRFARLKQFVTPDDLENELDMKMIAVLVKADQAGLFDILMKLFGAMGEDIQTLPKPWEEIEKFGLDAFFWDRMAATFGYRVSPPSLSDVLIRLLVNDLALTLDGVTPAALKHFLFKDSSLATNASVFVAQWRNHLGHHRTYRRLSALVSQELGMDTLLGGYNEAELLHVMTFESVEQHIIRTIRTKIVHPHLGDFDRLKTAILHRRDSYWASVRDAEESSKNIYKTAYAALDAVLELFELRQKFDAGFSYPTPLEMFRAYTSELFRFDQLYRLFHEAAAGVQLAGWDVLKEVKTSVEACYSDWYLDRLAMTWDSFMPGSEGLLENWTLDGIGKQKDFFTNHVKPILRSKPTSRVFVIISDGMRYEVAEELTRNINTKSRFKANLEPLWGVLPSYTALGMASLIPRTKYGYKQGTDQIQVDDQPCGSLEQRKTILGKREGICVHVEDLLAMNKDAGRDFIRPYRLVYVYHDQIDGNGHTATSAGEVFAGARAAVDTLTSLIRWIVNGLNGTNIFVTADHGFIYQDKPLGDLEKSGLDLLPEGIIKKNKRFILGNNLGSGEKIWAGTTDVTAGTIDPMEFWIPRGANRFYFSGGAQFIHGGAMPQEVIVPLVRVRELEGKTKVRDSVTRVGVSLLGSNRRIVNNIQKWKFIQTEKVSERTLSRSLVISIRDGDKLISDEVTATFDSASDAMEERTRSVKLMLKKGTYDNTKEYGLILRDPTTQIEYERIPVYIDLAFMNDF
jgi:uncharacterized protein (TIGR02687 family)